MKRPCSDYRKEIPKALLGDLSPGEQQALDLHLAECQPCNREQQMYAETIRQLRAEQDAPVPRHFFVYPDEAPVTPWRAFWGMSRVWQAAVASILLAAGLLASLALARIQVRLEDGALVLGFGRLPEPAARMTEVIQPVDTSALEARILQAVEERSHRENLELVRGLRAEIARSGADLSGQQRALLQQALDNVETRMGQLVSATATGLEARVDRSMQDLYRTVSLERANDLEAVDRRLNLLTVHGEMKSNETDEILATLIQVAELKLK